MLIKCKPEQKENIKKIIVDETGKMEVDFRAEDTAEGLKIDWIFPFDIDEDIEFIVPMLKHNNSGICKGPAEVFKKIKESYKDVLIEGFIEIGNDNNRSDCYFYSAVGDTSVQQEFAILGDEGNVPFSKCWFPFLTYNDYGLEPTGFVTKDEFKRFVKEAKKYAKEEEIEIDEFIDDTDMLSDFLSENNEEFEFPFPDDEDHLHALYSGAWEKYQE